MSESSSLNSVSSAQMDYMTLLVTQLQNQNPLEPMDNNEMASQLAQFSQLEQLESINSNFASVLATTEQSYATSLIGKEISFMTQTTDGIQELTYGTVQEIHNNMDGEIVLSVKNYAINLDDIVTIKN